MIFPVTEALVLVQSKAVAILHNRDPVSCDPAHYDVIVAQENMRAKSVQLNMAIVKTVYCSTESVQPSIICKSSLLTKSLRFFESFPVNFQG